MAPMAEPKGRSKSRVTPAPAVAAEQPQPEHVCSVGFCPICLAVSALQPLKPEVVEHLLNAGREFLLAVKAVVDAKADPGAEGPSSEQGGRLERIDIA